MSQEISKLKIGFQLDSSQLEKGMGFVLSNLNLMQKEFKGTMVGVDKFNKSIDDLGNEAQGLKGILDQQKIALSAIQNEYTKVAEAKGEDSKEAMKLRAKYIDMNTQMQITEQRINRVTQEMNEKIQKEEQDAQAIAKQTSLQGRLENVMASATAGLGKMNTKLGESGKLMIDLGSKITGATADLIKLGAKATLAGGALAVGLGGVALKQSIEMSNSVSDLQNRLGITREQAERLQGVSKNLWKQGWGDLPEIQDNISILKQQMRGLGDDELAGVTKAVTVMNKQFDADTNEITRTMKVMMNDLGVSSTEATDIMIAGFQGGLDSTGEWLDTLREYSPQFAEMGISGQQAFSMMKTAMDAGAWSLDKVADLLKEGHIRMQDMSKATGGAYEALGLNAEKTNELIAKGGADGAKAFQDVIVKLQGVQNEADRNSIATALFGTQYEDLREKIVFSMADGMKAVQDLSGVTQQATAVAEQSFGQKWAGAMNSLKSSMEPVGNALLTAVTDNMPQIQSAMDTLADKIASVDWSKLISDATTFAQSVIPPLRDGIMTVVNFIKNMDDNTKSTATTVGILALVMGPLLTAVGALTTVFSGALGIIRIISPLFSSLFGLFRTIAPFIGGAFTSVLRTLWLVFGAGAKLLSGTFMVILRTLSSVFNILINVGRVLIVVIGGISAPVWIAIAAIAAIVAIGVLLYKNWDTVKKYCIELGQVISQKFTEIKNAISEKIQSAMAKINEVFGNIGGWFKQKWNDVLNSITSFGSSVQSVIAKVVGFIVKPFKDINLVETGKDIIRGLGQGIEHMKDFVVDKVKAIGGAITGGIKKVLDIHSPSRVFDKEVGRMIPLGIVQGIETMTPTLMSATKKLANSAIPKLPNVNVPSYVQNGVQPANANHFSPTVYVQANDATTYVQHTERMLRRMQFQGGI